jgi:predicted aldo/keto reductase-like oxidoreductase
MTSESAHRKLGSTGPTVFPLALGCMGMSGMYGGSEDEESIAPIHAALDQGITLLDTGDFFGMGHNEMLIGRALKGRRDKALLSVKFGALRDPKGGWTGFDARPAALKNFAAYSLTRLGVDHIDIYRRRTQLSESLGAVRFELSAEDLGRIEKAIPSSAVAGVRYDEHQMQMLDSERGKGS